jgi:hypothetical protein
VLSSDRRASDGCYSAFTIHRFSADLDQNDCFKLFRDAVNSSRTDFAIRFPTVVHWMNTAAKTVRFQMQRLRNREQDADLRR